MDHLVVLAADLASGVAWCERTLGATPAAGGEHPLMGTHNRLLNVSSARHPRAYLEIIAINPGAASVIPASNRRWFDMDDATLQAQIAQQGPRLVHWVAAVPDVAAGRAALAAQGLDRGPVLAASRPTPGGLLQWQITVRPDGQRLLDGCLPTLIQWGERHPCDSLPASGVQLQALQLQHPQAPVLAQACAALGLGALSATTAAQPCLRAALSTPRGFLTLDSR
ncbi:hypothetical protein B2J86_11060 [Acidovorax sp. SRB_14]|uniref:VOC family protein n=1 Tax=Acidovorax sp. SRB_14 TaxID=1962699 RepID=UPI001EB16416|nr:hypothetical protein [Acidovorax sp. SRB_14]